MDVTSFPQLSGAEFETACEALVTSYNSLRNISGPRKWTSVETITSYGTKFMRIMKEFPISTDNSEFQDHNPSELDIQEEEDNDDEALAPPPNQLPVVKYDILLSPTYHVPTLYLYISDPMHRFPPAMSTLNEHIIEPAYLDQTKDVGVLGGITITDHPIENRPVFFIHPCRTAEVMKAIADDRKISPFEYLIMWIGAIGKCVGLDVPIELAVGMKDEMEP